MKYLGINMRNFWEKRKKQIKKIFIWYVVAIVFIFIVPLGINWIYKIPATKPLFAMDWEAKDVLSFYGSLLGAAATIFVLTETINFTRENQKEERKLSIKPYLETQKYNYTNFNSLPDDKNIIYMEIKPNIKTYQGALPEEIRDIIEFKNTKLFEQGYSLGGLDDLAYNQRVKDYFEEHHLLYYEISNCGAGNAINVVLKINNDTIIPAFCITTNSPKKIMFILHNDLLEGTENKDYKFELAFEYTDIASLGSYYQSEEVILLKRNRLITYQKESGFLSKPTELVVKNKG